MTNIRKVAKAAARRRAAQEYLDDMNIEECGKSRVHLGGLAEELHKRNLRALYKEAQSSKEDKEE
jgi:hypothetical protein